MDTSHSLSVFCCASQNFIRRDPNTPQLPHGNLMHRDRLRRRQRDLAPASRAVRCAGRHRDPSAHLPNQHRLRAFQSILSLAQLSGSSSVQENVWRRQEAHEECLDVRSVGEDLHGECVVRGEQLQLIVHRPLRRIGLRQVIDCNFLVQRDWKELARKRGRVAHSRRRRSSWLGCCCSPARTPPTHPSRQHLPSRLPGLVRCSVSRRWAFGRTPQSR